MAAFTLLAAMTVAAQSAVSAPAPPAEVLVRLAPGASADALGPSARPMVPAARAARLRAAAGRSARRAPDLTRWAVVPAPDRAAAMRLAARLRHLPGVRSATVPSGPGDAPAQQCAAIGEVFPLADGTPPDLGQAGGLREYLGMSTLPAGGDGAGVRVADVEYDWDPSHVELANRNLPQPYRPGSTPPENISHGTAVLSLIGGRSDGVGITGLVPRAELIPVGPWVGTYYSPAFAIAAAADQLDPGDVLLIEQQSRTKGPADTGEYGDSVADAIAAATAKGVIVVLPAGNGGRSIDAEQPVSDTAIVVGGGQIAAGAGQVATRHPSSNHGRRIDVQGPAHAVVTATAAPSYYPFLLGGAGNGSRSYTACFNGTSSASAAVAGAIAAMQGIARAQRGAPFTQGEILARLRATGRAQPDAATANVGPSPRVDLAADLTPPAAPRLVLDEEAQVASGAQVVRWSGVADDPAGSGMGSVQVLVDGRLEAVVAGDANEATVTLTPGDHRITVRAVDLTGNAAEASVAVRAITAPLASTTSPPLPPGVGNLRGLAGRLVTSRWNARRGILTLRFRTAPAARVRVDRRSVAAPRGVLRIAVTPVADRLVVVGAPGLRPLRLRVGLTLAGRVRIQRLR